MRKRNKDQGWLHHSRETLQLVMYNRNSILHKIRTTNEVPSSQTLNFPKSLQFKVDEAIVIAKNKVVNTPIRDHTRHGFQTEISLGAHTFDQ